QRMRLRYELLQSDCTEQGFVVAVGASHAAFVPWDRVRYIVTDRRGDFNGLLKWVSRTFLRGKF
ncbi:hypothetical protein, partial [Burkholderia anthina]|uniref:hypothetical protein n=2 Tax=Burkholderia anthina TaxID=179879 RepID=UPI001ABA1278